MTACSVFSQEPIKFDQFDGLLVQSVGEKIIIFQRSSVISFKQQMEKKFQLYKRRLLIL